MISVILNHHEIMQLFVDRPIASTKGLKPDVPRNFGQMTPL